MPKAPKKRHIVLTLLVLSSVLVLAVVAAAFYVVNPSGIFSSRPPEPAIVTITNSGFSPETVKVKKGQAVEWVNEDSSPHQIAADPYPTHATLPSLFAEKPLAQGEAFSYTFEDVGTFTYHDNLKPTEYQGTVIVE